MADFNPVAAFNRGRSNALSIRAQEQGIAREKQQAPIRNQLAKLGLGQAQRQDSQSISDQESQDVISKFKVIHQASEALLSIPEGQARAAAFQKLEPELERLGIPAGSFTAEQLTNANLNEAMQFSKSFITDPSRVSQLTGANKRIQDDTEILRGAIDENGQLIPVKSMTATQKAAAIRQGLIPAAGTTTKEERIALSSNLTEKVASSQANIKSAVKEVEAKVKAASDIASQNKSNEAALEVYEIGVKQLADSLGKTTQGPIASIFTSLTDEARAADGAVSIMLPVLKAMFRSSGEGTFTDKDQELLEAMLPTRKDNPKTAQSKLLMVDAVVQAKLRQRNANQSNSQPQQPQQQIQEGQTATNAQGQKIILQNGQWVPFNG
mgnify:CR=1 FL=1